MRPISPAPRCLTLLCMAVLTGLPGPDAADSFRAGIALRPAPITGVPAPRWTAPGG